MPKAYRLRIQNRRRRYQAGSKGRQPFERPSAKPRRAKPEKAVPGPLVKRSRHRPLTPVTRVRFPHGSPIAGVYNAEVPPVPIPNTEVKLSSAEDTWREAAWENRSMPAPATPWCGTHSSLAQSVEHAAVNRRVVRSSRTGGANLPPPLWRRRDLSFQRAISSVGQSRRLITGWSGVRVPDGPPQGTEKSSCRWVR